MYKNYIFDLYGTIVDIHTNERKVSLWKSMSCFMSLQGAVYEPKELKKAYGDTIKALKKESGITVDECEIDFNELIKRLYKAKGYTPSPEEISHWALMFRSISMEHLYLFPGAKELLERLHSDGKKVYLLSNAQRMITEPEMRYLGIYDLFDDVFYSSDAGFVKPSASFYQALIKKHGLDPKESVMVGNDWQADAWGAHKNGLDSMYIHTPQSTEITGPLPDNCRVLDDISQVYSNRA